ncbi:MAG: hypothetical protein WB588_05150 [Dehalococcoidia bacterium]
MVEFDGCVVGKVGDGVGVEGVEAGVDGDAGTVIWKQPANPKNSTANIETIAKQSLPFIKNLLTPARSGRWKIQLGTYA